ncbi:MAG TPA: tRNA 2-thiouridine(34) synthase MnmA [bacterium]|nr:tRNA 2-thiouridine(34) synthase MnmA [bacterium]HPL95744.1 tRNA 2-thiouridine(34) synthase MnmA [bacterium]
MTNNKKIKVLVAMSGGVDSSVAAKLLINAGHEVAGIFLKFWHFGDNCAENICCSTESFNDAKKVCQKLNIPLYTFNFAQPFKKEVVDNFINEYKNGRTPSPCVICNQKVKLGLLIKKARALGFAYVATGHYAQIKKQGQKFTLWRTKDLLKDQSYFLSRLTPNDLKYLLFPVGPLTKNQVRALAQKYHLPTAHKKESQEICFLGALTLNNFLKNFINIKPGPIKNEKNQTIGEHLGAPLYTLGQRQGLKINQPGPFYVYKINAQKNIIYVTPNPQSQLLNTKKMLVKKVSWLSAKTPPLPLKCLCQIRSRHKPAACIINKKGANYQIIFTQPQKAITPGQNAAFYQGKKLLGCGVIK